MPVRIEDILSTVRRSLPSLQSRRGDLQQAIRSHPSRRPSFRAALRRRHLAVIAEVKRRSPSAGSIREDLDPGDRAALYAAHGAAAISVLTDGPYFGGSLEHLEAAARRCPLPLLRKDFILDEIQILEARAAGASAVLLIVRALERPQLGSLLRCAAELDLDSLVEVHSRRELDSALESGANIIGVNSRDLDTFRVDVETAWRLLSEVPRELLAVAESGIGGRADVLAAAEAGADAVLVGTALSAAPAPEQLLRDLAGVPRRER
jgi:indole-3-glycerol phosphate synthase